MIRDIATFGWKVGLALIFLLPMLYLLQWAVLLAGLNPNDGIAGAVYRAMQFLPAMLLAIGLGTMICLLVRIETHLRNGRD
ncbi:hypothetical protein [Brevundimonas sp.]|uniref:hypothetical protein n=1 Tax=Brevundimonas sp. TaxID=1871086 RepID=UPI003D13CBD0